MESRICKKDDKHIIPRALPIRICLKEGIVISKSILHIYTDRVSTEPSFAIVVLSETKKKQKKMR